MNLPENSMTSASPPSSTSENPTDTCDDCGSQDSLVIHTARLRGTLRFFCTNCLLRNHPSSFCPSCFIFYDSSPPHTSRRVQCTKCSSWTHIQCTTSDTTKPTSSYLCPPCRSPNPNSFSFFRPITGVNGVRSIDKPLAEAFYCAAKIAASSMTKALTSAKVEAERRGKEAALARKRAREALEEVVILDAKEKAKSASIPKLKEASIEVSTRIVEQKPKVCPSSNGVVKESENNGGNTEKQSPQLAKVKQEGR